ncbi:MAG: S41 family peptidase [Pseudomonadota bacterium]
MTRLARGLFGVLVLFVAGCGLPTNQLTKEERIADMNWAFTVFKHNYAPLQLKKDNFGVEMSAVEADCLTLAEEDMENDAFLALFQKCIHSFKDAHVGGQQLNNGMLPEFAEVAHLGFVTVRTRIPYQGQIIDALRIVAPLKGSEGPGAPLVKGDLIIAADGKDVAAHMMDEIVPYINVGQDETSLSMAGFRFSVRTSMDMALPEKEDIELKIIRGMSQFDITMPWIVEDLHAFQLKQAPPEEQAATDGETPESAGDLSILQIINPLASRFFGYQELKTLFDFVDEPLDFVVDRVRFIAQQGFQLARFNPILSSLFKTQGDLQRALNMRNLPMAAQVDDLMDEPGFVAKSVVLDSGEKYAYLQLSNFPAEDKILTEWNRAINAIEDKGIKSVVIDLIDNGGGSLVHGMRILNMVRRKSLQVPSMQVRLNNNWMNAFKTQAAFGANDYAKAIGRNVVEKLEEDKADGKKISRPLPVTILDPFFLQNPAFGLGDDVKIALLVNEMCVSMCDIFASVFQDNEMGQVIGQRTMGGGGNVAQHGVSPVSKFGIALTESLIISPKGEYLEDQGVTPDVKIDMVADRERRFGAAMNAALNYLLGPAPTPTPN